MSDNRERPDPGRMEAVLRLIAAGRGPDRYDGLLGVRQPRVTRAAMRDLARQALATTDRESTALRADRDQLWWTLSAIASNVSERRPSDRLLRSIEQKARHALRESEAGT